MHIIFSRIGLLLVLLLSVQAWSEPGVVLASKDGFSAAHPSDQPVDTSKHFRTEPQGEAFPEWDSSQIFWALLAISGIGAVLFWLGRRRSHPTDLMPPTADRPWTNSIFAGPAAGLAIEELSSVEEEAEVFFLLGRLDLAIGVLRHYIESNSDAPAHVWMSLLDILHAQGLRLEFEKLALEAGNHFNIDLPTWEAANERSNGMAGLEHFPRICARIAAYWNEPDCTDYLRSLLQDHHNGEHGGFRMEAFQELSFLIGLQEQKR